ncbi:MAG: phage holin family protein [bacterium]
MSPLLLQWTINALAIILAVKTIPGMSFHGKWWYMLIIGAIFGMINSLIRPIMRFFMYPIIILTLGIFTTLINASMLALTSLVSRVFNLGLVIDGFWPAFFGALVVSMVSAFLSWLIGSLGGRDSGGKEKKSY